MTTYGRTTGLALFGLCIGLAGPAGAIETDVSGDVRTGFFSLHRDDRDGSSDTTDEFRLRLRAGVGLKFSEQWMAKIRFAGRYSTDDRNRNHFEIFGRIPAEDGLRRGDSTLDEIYLEHRPNATWSVRAGRFQSKAELAGVAKKSLDRNDSPNVDITWTDGIQVTHKAASGWATTLIAQYNHHNGPTQVRRGQLNFRDNDSRVSYFTGFENTQPAGPIVQRAFDVTFLPEALHSRGIGSGTVENYWGLAGRLAAQWPVAGSMKFMLAGEVGYAPNTPQRSATRTGASGDADGLAVQVSFNFIDFVPWHSAALVLGRAGDGWLISPDFPENTNLVEVRYQWSIAKNQSIEARLRHREDIKQRTGSSDKREDVDYYVRYTYQF
jgi:hypothetical protein